MPHAELTRAAFLRGAAATTLAAALPARANAAPRRRASRFGGLPTKSEIWDQQLQLGRWSPPYVGTAGHDSFLDLIAGELEGAGLEAQRRSFTFDAFQPPSRVALRTAEGEPLPVATHQHYSGPTGPEGVTAKLAWVGTSEAALTAAQVAGRIAVFELPALALPEAINETLAAHPPEAADDAGAGETNPAYTFLSSYAPRAEAAMQLGAVGAIFAWGPEFSEAAVEHQVPNWKAAPLGIPALFVGNAVRGRLEQLATADREVTIVLESTIDKDRTTDNVWAVLPGETDEVITVHTHSDGCNAYEENGGIAVAAMARHFARVPRSQRRRTLVFAATAGHFGNGLVPGAETFREEEDELFERTVACVTAEHLGADEWVDDARGRYGATGRYELDWVYTRPGRAMADVMIDAARGTGFRTFKAVRPHANQGGYQFGEGREYAAAGKACISTMGHPWYLFTQPPHGEVGKISKDRLYGEIVALTKATAALDRLPTEDMQRS
jgi:hypothetical protein